MIDHLLRNWLKVPGPVLNRGLLVIAQLVFQVRPNTSRRRPVPVQAEAAVKHCEGSGIERVNRGKEEVEITAGGGRPGFCAANPAKNLAASEPAIRTQKSAVPDDWQVERTPNVLNSQAVVSTIDSFSYAEWKVKHLADGNHFNEL